MKRLLGDGGALLCFALLLRCWLLGSSACPCEQPALCKPISTQYDFETWKSYDWTQITTVATFGDYDPELICYAHSKGSRVVLKGYDHYIRMGINPKKLVMGVPWYGYDYTCPNLVKDHVCFFAKNVFSGAPCNNATIRQAPYRIIMTLEKTSTSGILWDEEQKAPFLEYKDSKSAFHQVWFDNPKSISLKSAYAKEHGLRGIGMWNANCLNYSANDAAQRQTETMWKALKGA